MSLKKILVLLPFLIVVIGLGTTMTSCDGGINLFSLSDDINLGKQVEAQILSNPSQYPILDSARYASTYQYLKDIRNRILQSGKVSHVNDFQWKTYIIRNDTVLNAFCVPGGYIFVYTGIIKYLDNEDQFAGVLAHEIAHADQRHSTQSMTTQYGIQTLLDVVLGKNQGALVQIASGLASLKFSRTHEADADAHSVMYLSGTQSYYACNGAAGFFQKLCSSPQGCNGGPAFLSTHPDPGDRITSINSKATELGCSITPNPASLTHYQAFKSSLP
jgi:predicted Zn-dependent protease